MRWVYLVGVLGIVGTLAADPWMDNEDYKLGANLSLIYLAFLSTCFTIRYIGWANWRANKIGQIFALFSVLLTLTLIQACFSVWTQSDYPGREYVRFVIYSGGVLGMLGMLLSLWQHQRRDRKKECQSSKSDPPDLM
ncbi:hypothetical protein FF47_31 [Mycobacterium phage FF47]|uniref:Holin n=2 Tax=Mapvirus Ff47 TaxID=1920751 RepID=A0A899INH7_9CAUD|nr:hypothetical protein FF47_31 [Mycobacterium phage FF47]AGI12299.1 putative membrane protein [Mycobacterium phage FF47]QSL99640.1 hypothetical protein [Mycobacterium phage Maco2]WKV22156.1 hypothetical protein 8UZL_00038 [Mycobacteroides phage 8UZL]